MDRRLCINGANNHNNIDVHHILYVIIILHFCLVVWFLLSTFMSIEQYDLKIEELGFRSDIVTSLNCVNP